MSTTRRVYKVKKTKKKRRKRLWLLLVPLLVLGLGATTYAATIYLKAQDVFKNSYDPVEASAKRSEAVDPLKDNFSILFIGIDDSDKRDYKGHSRSDALILATFNKDQKSIKLLSIPRDSYVYVPAKGVTTKINAAHAAGGPKATMDTVEELLDIPVDYYVRMNFNAFIDVVDSLDGIKVDVPYEINELDSHDKKNGIHLEKGLQTVDGEEALAFARTRKKDSDIQRGERQQEVLKAIVAKAASAGSITKYTDVMEAVGDNMTTNLQFSQIKGFIKYVTTDKGLNLETLKLEGRDSYINGTYYYQLNDTSVANTKQILRSHLNLGPKEGNQTEAVQSQIQK
ncbi:transcriptional regulator [Peribacillus simplex]|uniref:LCP family protein n=1 Tax=Peribacillus simplex TaxID=1478 RepID=A0AAW7I5Z0_9BACI|nr:LCP family protein [Peribacillus simplex]AMM95104.1 transcriptional regulator [Peribacillus simplex]MDM5451405.1 LCP family protein [Peribacillus simplex]